MPEKTEPETQTPEAELRSYIARLDPDIQKLARSVRAALRKMFPTANELAYDYKTFVVIAYSPTDHGINGIASIAARPDGVRLYLSPGPQLPDPTKRLKGSGTQVRFIPIEAVSDLKEPDLQALITSAIERAPVPLPTVGRGKLIIRSTTARRTSSKGSPKPRPHSG